jgi:hypothetical protein
VNFTTAMPDANYSVVATRGGNPTVGFIIQFDALATPQTGSVRFACVNAPNNAFQDTTHNFVAIFR